jgi:cytochrome b pre-mRNA-processing protein 3
MLRFFSRDKTDPRVRALYDGAVAQARLPVFYRRHGVPDTVDGRFDMILLHLAPLVDALRDEGGAITAEGQALFDTFLADMEQNLRTMGVGDTTVPKKMRRIGEAFYGRFDAYRNADGRAGLARVAARNVLGDEARADAPEALALADYALALRAAAIDPLAGIDYPDPEAFLPRAEGAAA